jgi:RNA polymerase sigma-70 factor (ECF subfamily)
VSQVLVESFLTSVDPSLQPALAAMTDLSRRLEAMFSEAREAWPDVVLEGTRFMVFIAQRLSTDRPADEALTAVRAADLYLACACAHGDKAALELFDKRYISDLGAALARMRPRPEQLDEIKQQVRQRLFVSDKADTGKIVEYSGRGDIRRWVRAIAIRTFLNHIRKHKREIPSDPDQPIFDEVSDDPEIEYMKRRYSQQFRAAFVQALRELGDREQTLLRYHHVDGLNIDDIGAIYRVHRVTAYRWLEKARESLVNKIQGTLERELQVEHREFKSIMRMIRSQLHLSLVRHLNEVAKPDGEPEG